MTKLLILIPILAVTLGGAQPRTQSRIDVPAALAARADAGEGVSVIVGVATAFVPEGNLPAGAVADQRDGIAQALDAVMASAAAVGVTVGERFDFIPFFVATVNRAGLEALATMPGVTSIEENRLHGPTLSQSVPLINAPNAWSAGATGAGWTVAVLDSGVQRSHPFLGGRTVAEGCYSASAGGSSLCPGAVKSSTAVGSGEACGFAGCDHGTHVAGIAVGANGPGGSNGVARSASLIPIQVFTRFDGANCGASPSPCLSAYTSDIISGLNRVLALAGSANVNRIAAVNLSLGGGRYFTQSACDAANPATKAAIDNLRSIGVAAVIASGNNSYGDALSAPGCISSAVSVGATTDVGTITVPVFSNEATFLSLRAPGVGITSSVTASGFGDKAGTSMAAPHVAGAWAILKQSVPAASVANVLAALVATGTPVREPFTGNVRPLINVNAARLALLGVPGGPSVPGVPTSVSAAINGNNLTLSWGLPASGGAPTSYSLVVMQSPVGTGTFALGNVLTFSGAVPNGAYKISILALNGTGAGPAAGALSFNVPTLAAPPGSPTGLAGIVAGSTVGFTWNAPISGGPVANYLLQVGTTPGFVVPVAALPVPPAPRSFSAGGVPAGSYYVRVVAQNAGGTSLSSNEVLVVVAGAAPPGPPTLNLPVVVGNTLFLSWVPGGGGTATGYILSASMTPGGVPFVSAPLGGATSVSAAGVPAGTYYLRLAAANAVGTSLPSNEITAVVR